MAALLVLGYVPTERLPWIATDWLVSGLGGAATAELAGLSDRDVREAGDLLPFVLEELGVTLPDCRVDAAAVYFSHLAALYQAGRIDEYVILDAVETIDSSAFEPGVHDLPLGTLFGVTDEWNADWGRPRHELRDLLTTACEVQLRKYPAIAAPFKDDPEPGLMM